MVDRMWVVAGTILPSMLISWLVVWWVRRRAPTWGLVDQPGSRKVHHTPTPMGGGLGIWSGVVLSFLLGYILLRLVDLQGEVPAWVPSFVQPHLIGLQSQLGELTLLLVGDWWVLPC